MPDKVVSLPTLEALILRNPVRFFTYLIYNPVFKKEVFEKQGMTFGCREKDELDEGVKDSEDVQTNMMTGEAVV